MKCKICGKEFELLKENRMIVRDSGRTGLATILADAEEEMYDSFDCPHCGCQNVIQERKRSVTVAAFLNMGDQKYEDCSGNYDCNDEEKSICLWDKQCKSNALKDLESNEHNMQILKEAKEELESGGGTYYEPDWEETNEDDCDEASNDEKKHYSCTGCEFELNYHRQCKNCFVDEGLSKRLRSLRKNYKEYNTNKENLEESYVV